MASAEKPVMVVALDDSEHSYYALGWTLEHFFVGAKGGCNQPFSLVIVHAKPSPTSVINVAGPGGAHLPPSVGSDLDKMATGVVEKARELCAAKLVTDVHIVVAEGDARYVLCDAVDERRAAMLVLGSHGYGTIKRALSGSVSDYCSHHAHCPVMIVKRPKMKH